MKKILYLFLPFIIGSSLSLVACGGGHHHYVGEQGSAGSRRGQEIEQRRPVAVPASVHWTVRPAQSVQTIDGRNLQVVVDAQAAELVQVKAELNKVKTLVTILTNELNQLKTTVSLSAQVSDAPPAYAELQAEQGASSTSECAIKTKK